MNAQTRNKALRSLDGMAQIVSAEMLIQRSYVSDEIDETMRSQGAICGGHKFCAVGSLWAGAGIKPRKYRLHGDIGYALPGVAQYERPDFLAERPGLRLAYDCLNAAAEAYTDARELWDEVAVGYDAAIESLFEGTYDYGGWGEDSTIDRDDLLEVIEDARTRVLAAA